MRIGIDATPINDQLTGIGNYLFYLLEELLLQRRQDQFFLYAIRDSERLNAFKKYPHVTLRVNACLGISEALWSQTTLSWMCYQDRLDRFWGVTQSIPLLARKRQRQLITVHDFTYLLYPKTTSSVRGFYLRRLSKLFYKRAHVRISNSAATAHRLRTLYSLSSDLIIRPPLKRLEKVESPLLLNRWDLLPKRYFLIVSTLEPRKNLIATVRAYHDLLETHGVDPLVIVGKRGWKEGPIIQEIDRLKQHYPNQVRVAGYLPDEELNALVYHAKAYIMPSLYEGYGMPIAEARALGTPVICCTIPEMVEAAEGDGVFINPAHFKSELQQALLFPTLSLKRACCYESAATLAAALSQALT